MELVEDPHTRQHIEEFFNNNIYREIPQQLEDDHGSPGDRVLIITMQGGSCLTSGRRSGRGTATAARPPGELSYPMFEQQVFPVPGDKGERQPKSQRP